MRNDNHTNRVFHLRFLAEIFDQVASVTEADGIRADARTKAARMRIIASRYDRPFAIAAE